MKQTTRPTTLAAVGDVQSVRSSINSCTHALLSVSQSFTTDLLAHTFCYPCALSQESRAVVFADKVAAAAIQPPAPSQNTPRPELQSDSVNAAVTGAHLTTAPSVAPQFNGASRSTLNPLSVLSSDTDDVNVATAPASFEIENVPRFTSLATAAPRRRLSRKTSAANWSRDCEL